MTPTYKCEEWKGKEEVLEIWGLACKVIPRNGCSSSVGRQRASRSFGNWVTERHRQLRVTTKGRRCWRRLWINWSMGGRQRMALSICWRAVGRTISYIRNWINWRGWWRMSIPPPKGMHSSQNEWQPLILSQRDRMFRASWWRICEENCLRLRTRCWASVRPMSRSYVNSRWRSHRSTNWHCSTHKYSISIKS